MSLVNDLRGPPTLWRTAPASRRCGHRLTGRLLSASLVALVPTTMASAHPLDGYGVPPGQASSVTTGPMAIPTVSPEAVGEEPMSDGSDTVPAPQAESPQAEVYGPVVTPDPGGSSPSFTWSEPPPATPPALAEAIAIATEKDPSVQGAWLAARAALQDVRGARWLRFPALSTGLVFYDRSSPITEQFAPSVVVQLPLWTGGRIGANIKRAKNLELSAIANWRAVILDIAQQVADAYYNIVLSTRLEAKYKENLAAHQRLVETIRRRVDQEINPAADLQLARSRTAQVEQELAGISAQRLASLRTLAELVRDPNYSVGPVPVFNAEKVAQNWDNVVAEAVAFSPNRERLQYEADAAADAVKISRGSIFPQVNAQYSYSDVVGSRIGVGLQLQTSNGLSQFSAVSAAAARARQATQQVGLAVRQLKQNVEVQRVTQEASVRRAKVSEVASETATKVSESYVRQFIAGRRSWLDLLNSLRENLANQTSLTQAEVGAQAAATRLNLLSGRWRLVHDDSKK